MRRRNLLVVAAVLVVATAAWWCFRSSATPDVDRDARTTRDDSVASLAPKPVGEARVGATSPETLALEGVVVDARTAQPIAGASIEVTRDRELARDDPQGPDDLVQADARGVFRIEHLSRGLHTLAARTPGHVTTVLRGLEVPHTALRIELRSIGGVDGQVVDRAGRPTSRAEVVLDGQRVSGEPSPPVRLRADEAGVFHADLQPGNYRATAHTESESGISALFSVAASCRTAVKVRMGRAASVAGQVTARADRSPIAGAHVAIVFPGGSTPLGTATSDSSGRYRVEGLPAGDASLRVTASTYSPFRANPMLALTEGKTFSFDVPLDKTSGVRGTVVDGNQKLQADVEVRLARFETAEQTIRTDDSGRFVFEDVASGPARLSALRRDGAQTAMDVRLSPGEVNQVQLVLGEQATISGKVATASGRTLDQGVEVVVSPATGSDRLSLRPAQVEGGRYTLKCAPGAYQVMARSLAGANALTSATHVIQALAGQTANLDLVLLDDPSHGIHGTVLEPDGTPSVNATVVLDHVTATGVFQSFIESRVSDREGHFDFGQAATQGENRLQIDARNGGRHRTLIGAFPEGSDVTITLGPSSTLHGRVTRSDGKRVESFLLLVVAASDGSFAMRRRVEGDTFHLEEVWGEPLTVQIWSAGWSGSAQASPKAGEDLEVNIGLRAAARVVGTLVDLNGAPVQTRVNLYSAEGRGLQSNRTDARGTFAFEGLSPGRYDVITEDHRFETKRVPADSTEGTTTDLGAITLKPFRPAPGEIGAWFQDEAGQLRIFDVFQDGPAAQAGARVGDVLLAVNGNKLAHASEAMRAVTGAPGTAVVLTVVRDGRPLDLTVVRAQ